MGPLKQSRMADSLEESYPIAGNYQANVGRCMVSAPNVGPKSSSRADLRDRDSRSAQIVERSSHGVFDAEVKRPAVDAESELQYFKEEIQRYAAEIRRLALEVNHKDQALAAAHDEIRRLNLTADLAAPAAGFAPSGPNVSQLFHQRALQQAGWQDPKPMR